MKALPRAFAELTNYTEPESKITRSSASTNASNSTTPPTLLALSAKRTSPAAPFESNKPPSRSPSSHTQIPTSISAVIGSRISLALSS